MPARMRIFHIHGDQFDELHDLPDRSPPQGYLWVAVAREVFEAEVGTVQAALERWTGGSLVDLHVIDLANTQIPSSFDYSSAYDLLVFRRLAALHESGEGDLGAGLRPELSGPGSGPLAAIDTSPEMMSRWSAVSSLAPASFHSVSP